MNKIVIVGQTNVGKSKLFNMLSQKNLSIVFDGNDTTVDYVSLTVGDKILVDTAGVTKESHIVEGDLYLYIVPITKPLCDRDKTLINQLKKRQKPIWLIVNCIDGPKVLQEPQCKSLRCDQIFYTSGEHNLGIDELREALEITIRPKFLPTIAIVGRCNSGKSTLMNALLRENRMITSPIEGTTRDTVRESIVLGDKSYDFMDTAGYRKECDILEHITAKRRSNCLSHCVGSIVLLNGPEGFTKVDKEIFKEAWEKTNFVIVAVNKKELMDNPIKLSFIPSWVPVVYISALHNQLGMLRQLITQSYESSQKKFTTNSLNKWLRTETLNMRSLDNKPIKLKYITQFSSEPITIGTDKEINEVSQKQLSKKLTTYFNLVGTKILWTYMKK